MFGIGYLELMVLGLLVILLFPPRELPKLARSAARLYGSVRRIADDFHRTVMLDDELRQPIDEIRGAYDEARWDFRRAGDRMKRELGSVKEQATSALKPNSKASDPAPSSSSAPADASDERDEDASPGTDVERAESSKDGSKRNPARPVSATQEKQDDRARAVSASASPSAGAPEAPEEGWESSELPPINPAQPTYPPDDDTEITPLWATGELGPDEEAPAARDSEPAPGPGTDAQRRPPALASDAAARPTGSLHKPNHPSLHGRVASGSSSQDILDEEPQEAAPSDPSPQPDEIDESALTRVARLPMPKSFGDGPDDPPPSSPNGASSSA